MRYTLTYICCVLFILIADTSGISVNINPNPATVSAGDKLIVTSTITKAESESWKSFVFYVYNGVSTAVCSGAFYYENSACIDEFSCDLGYGFNCNYITFNLVIDAVTTSMSGLTIHAVVTFKNSPSIESLKTKIQVKVPLQGITLTPHGTITKKESETQTFLCSAKSLPIATLSWIFNGSILPTLSPPVITTDTITSSYTYTAQKDDNGKTLMCTAVYNSTSFPKSATINVLYRPMVTISPFNNPFRVLESSTNLLLTCNVIGANPSVESFFWTKDGSTTPGENTYTIQRVDKSHAGRYTCNASNSVGSSESSNAIQLEVLYGAGLNTIPKKEPIEGTQLRIICSGQSNPAMTDNDVTWNKQNSNTFNKRGKQLVIDNVNRIDSGTYVCSVTIKLIPTIGQPINVTGKTTVEVDVSYLPTVTISPNYAQFKVIENTTNLVLECNVTDANPAVTSYKWYKDGSEIDGYTDASYTISTVQIWHTGQYTCDAENSAGTSNRSSVINLNILYGIGINLISKKEVKEMKPLFVSCNVTSNPEVTNSDVTWTKQNNATFSRKGQNLVIDHVQKLDSGIYVCSVIIKLTPTLGQSVNVTGTATVDMSVVYRPTVKISPDFNQYNVVENTTNLQLTCTVTDANPAVTSYRWYKGSLLVSNIMSTYTIPTVLRSHTGSYKCDATNSVGTSFPSSDVQLNILYGVELYHIENTSINEGTHLTITCSGNSYPVMTQSDVKWSKQNNNTFSRIGQQLVIDNVNRLDSGTFVCSVIIELIPTVGHPGNVTGTTFAEVDVRYRPDVNVSPDKNPYKVIENTTNINLTCNVTDAHPAEISYKWYKYGNEVSTAETYIISPVNRSHSGSYSCVAANAVGSSNPSSVVQLDVLYGVSLKLSVAAIRINETDSWKLSCIGDGNPLPEITCVYKYNSTAVSEQSGNATVISVDQANCADTGLYMCSGNNTIGEPVSRSANVEVACKPRTYNNVKKDEIFISGTDESLNISTRFISFPLSQMSWSRELPDGNFTNLGKDFINTTIPSQLPYETISILHKFQLKPNDFGIYVVTASNVHGSFVFKYHITSKRAPDKPTNITAVCDVTSVIVTWISRFNGGEHQFFRIILVNNKSHKTQSKEGITDIKENGIINQAIESLNPDTLYLIFLEATNSFGTTNSTEIANCTTKPYQTDDQHVSTALVGGISGSISAVLIVFIVLGGLFLWRRRQLSGVDKELIHRAKDTDEDEEEGLKENPLYVTSGGTSNAEVGPVYGVVNKPKQKSIAFDEHNDQGPVYSQVQKSNILGKRRQKEKKNKKDPKNDNCKDIELGTVYENSDKLFKYKSSDEIYANAEEQEKDVNTSKMYSPKKNKDGLIYADLDLIPGPTGSKFVIRGIENRTNYAMIDLSIKVDPLPSDDEDEDADNGNEKSADIETRSKRVV